MLLTHLQHVIFTYLLTIAQIQKDSIKMIRSGKARSFYPEKLNTIAKNYSKGNNLGQNYMAVNKKTWTKNPTKTTRQNKLRNLEDAMF